MKETIASKRSAGNWFSTLMCGAIASGTSANHHLKTSTHPSAHGDRQNVKRAISLCVLTSPPSDPLCCSGLPEIRAPAGGATKHLRGSCQVGKRFPEVFQEIPLTPCVLFGTHVEKLRKTTASGGSTGGLSAADQSVGSRKELRSQPHWTRMELDSREPPAVKARSRAPSPTDPSASARPPIAQDSSRDRPPVHRLWRPSGQRHGRRSRRSGVP